MTQYIEMNDGSVIECDGVRFEEDFTIEQHTRSVSFAADDSGRLRRWSAKFIEVWLTAFGAGIYIEETAHNSNDVHKVYDSDPR